MPTQNLVLWLDSSIGTGTSPVTAWLDQSGEENNATTHPETLENPPTLTLTDSDLNNLPSVSFSAFSNQALQTGIKNFAPISTTGFDIFIVLQRGGYPNSFSMIFMHSTSRWNSGFGILRSSDGSLRGWVNDWNETSTRVDLTESDIPLETGTIIHFSYDRVNIKLETYAPSPGKFVRKTVKIAATPQAYSSPVNLYNINYASIARGGSNLYDMTASYGEILLYTGVLDVENTNNVLSSLSDKYNIPLA